MAALRHEHRFFILAVGLGLTLFLAGTAIGSPPRGDVGGEADIAEFQRTFAAEIEAARATPGTDDDGRLAVRIYVYAQQRSDRPRLVAVALGEVIRLARESPRHQDLAYAALRTLKDSGLRPEVECLEEMLAVVPGALRQLEGPAASQWLERVAVPDTLHLARLHLESCKFAEAVKVLHDLESALIARGLAVPEVIGSNLRGARLLGAARTDAEAALTGNAALYAGVIGLLHDASDKGAADRLRQSGIAAAVELADALDAVDASGDAAAAGRLIKAAERTPLPSLIEAQLLKALIVRGGPRFQRVVSQGFFGLPLYGSQKVVFLIDCSGSMSGGRMARAASELKTAVDALMPEQQFQVIFFNTTSIPMPDGLKQATNANKDAAVRFIDSVGPGGGTNPTRALEDAFQLQPETIYVLTDGEFQRVVIDVIDKLNSDGRVVVNTICLFSRTGQEQLQEIARRNKGSFRNVE
jgi:hypothetical protein